MLHDGMGLPEIEAHADDGRRGLLVVGELQDSQQAAAAARIGVALGWPVVADVLSGERLRWCDDAQGPALLNASAHCSAYMQSVLVVHLMAVCHSAGLRLGRQGQSLSRGAAPSPLMSHMDHILLLDQVCCTLGKAAAACYGPQLKVCAYIAWSLWKAIRPRCTLHRRGTGQQSPRTSSCSWGAT